MKTSRLLSTLGFAAVVVSGCGTANTATTPAVPPATPQAAVQRDLLSLLPDTASIPSHLKPVGDPTLLTLENAAKNALAWNGFGTLIAEAKYEPTGCTAVRAPDVAPYASGPFAWKYYSFKSKSNSKASVLIGMTIGRGEVDKAAVRALTAECAVVSTKGDVSARYEILPNPRVSSAQILAIKTEIGSRGAAFRLTYVAQIGEYIVTTYTVCEVFATCEKEIVPVFQNAVSKAESA